MAIFIKEVVTDDANTFSFKLVMGCFDYEGDIHSKYRVAFFRKKGLAEKNGKVLNELASDVNEILGLLYPKYRIEVIKYKLLFNVLVADGKEIAETGQYCSSYTRPFLRWIKHYLIFIYGVTASKEVIGNINSVLDTMSAKNDLLSSKSFDAYTEFKTDSAKEIKTFIASIQGKAIQSRYYAKCSENETKKESKPVTTEQDNPQSQNWVRKGYNWKDYIPYFFLNSAFLPNGVDWRSGKVKAKQPKPIMLDPRSFTKQIDDLPKIEGVWMGEERIGGSEKRKAQIGSIVLSFTRVVSDGKDKYRLDRIEGVLIYEKLPKRYLDGGPSIFLDCDTSTTPQMTYCLVLPNGSVLFETGKVYTQSSLVAKLQYLVKAGQRLRDIKREQARKDKEQKATWKGSFVVQV